MPTTTTTSSSTSAADYAALLHSEQASLEAALSFLAECDDGAGSGGAGAAWRLLQDASSHDMDVDIDEGGDEQPQHHEHQQQYQHARAFVREHDDDDDDSDDTTMLSALLEAEHIPVIETPGASVPSSSFHEAARTKGYTSYHTSSTGSTSAYGFVNESPTTEYQPQHNPGMMMAMMSAGFPTIDFNPQSLLMAPAHSNDSSGSESNSPMASIMAVSSSAAKGSAAGGSTTTPKAGAATSTALVKKRPAKKKPAGYNSNRARDERKEELIYLRKTVLEMEERLSKLKQSTPAPQALSVDFSPNSSSSSTSSSLSSASTGDNGVTTTPAQVRSSAAAQQLSNSVWEDIATRQYKERRRAELENIRLKLILEGQIKMAKALEKILKKRTSLRVRCYSSYTVHCKFYGVLTCECSLLLF